MKSSGVCPKCGSTKIYGPHRGKPIQVSTFFTATLHVFICSECGYAEWYSDKMGIANIREGGKIFNNPQQKTSQKHQSPEQRICLFCSTPIQPNAVICPECGNNFDTNVETSDL